MGKRNRKSQSQSRSDGHSGKSSETRKKVRIQALNFRLRPYNHRDFEKIANAAVYFGNHDECKEWFANTNAISSSSGEIEREREQIETFRYCLVDDFDYPWAACDGEYFYNTCEIYISVFCSFWERTDITGNPTSIHPFTRIPIKNPKIGKIFFQKLKLLFQAQDMKKIFLNAISEAQGFWEKQGFELDSLKSPQKVESKILKRYDINAYLYL